MEIDTFRSGLNNIFRIKSIDTLFSDEIIQNIQEELNSSKLMLGSHNLFDAFLGKNLLRLELQVFDLVKLQLISNQLENELSPYSNPNCSFKVKEIDSIISKVKRWKKNDKYGFVEDISKFFSTINHDQIYSPLNQYNVPQNTCILVESFLT